MDNGLNKEFKEETQCPHTVERSYDVKGRHSSDHQPKPPFYGGKLRLREVQWRALWQPTHLCRIKSTLPWKCSLEIFIHQTWTEEVAALHIQTCMCGFWENAWDVKGDPKALFALLSAEYEGPSSSGLAALCRGFQRLRMWDTELKRHSRSAPICLDDNL